MQNQIGFKSNITLQERHSFMQIKELDKILSLLSVELTCTTILLLSFLKITEKLSINLITCFFKNRSQFKLICLQRSTLLRRGKQLSWIVEEETIRSQKNFWITCPTSLQIKLSFQELTIQSTWTTQQNKLEIK